MERIIWQPEFCSGYDFNVYLDRVFAREMIKTNLSSEQQNRMNELANEELQRRNVHWRYPYTFHENSCFIQQFYIGSNGTSLSTGHQSIKSLIEDEDSSKLIKYKSHNVDSSKQAFVLMKLVDMWVYYYSDV